MTPYIWVNIGSNYGLVPDDTKPLPKPMLTYQWITNIKFVENTKFKIQVQSCLVKQTSAMGVQTGHSTKNYFREYINNIQQDIFIITRYDHTQLYIKTMYSSQLSYGRLRRW